MSKRKNAKLKDKSKKLKLLFIIFLSSFIFMLILGIFGLLNWLTIFPLTTDARRRRLENKIHSAIKKVVENIEIKKEHIEDYKQDLENVIQKEEDRKKVERLLDLLKILNTEIIPNAGDKTEYSNKLEALEKALENDSETNPIYENKFLFIKNMMKVKN